MSEPYIHLEITATKKRKGIWEIHAVKKRKGIWEIHAVISGFKRLPDLKELEEDLNDDTQDSIGQATLHSTPPGRASTATATTTTS